ncbi:MAG: hypothetical protein H7175_02050 [Burkholderiales bacterium]|nr:hypothetical protein [Anaerolineae bacterium]
MNGEPAYIQIHCPRCGKRARLDESFEFTMPQEEKIDTQGKVHRWGGWLVVEKYPNLVPWVTPGSGVSYQHWSRGVVKCPHCHLVAEKALEWPADAFYKWPLRGDLVLWAYNEEHARAILDYVGSKSRKPSGDYAAHLRKIPKEMLSAKARETLVKQLTASLEEENP